MQEPVVRISNPSELAAVVPQLLGFAPQESLVVLSLRGPRRRLGLVFRVDLPADPVPGDQLRSRAGLPAQVAEAMQRDCASSCAVLVHTSAPSTGHHPQTGLVDAVHAELATRGIAVRDAVLVRGGRWWSYRCSSPCCPPTGSDVCYEAPSVQRVAAEKAYAGRAVLASRDALVASIAPVLPLGRAVAVQRQQQAMDDLVTRRTRAPVSERELRRWRAALTASAEGAVVPVAGVAPLVVALHDVEVRDSVAAWGFTERESLLALLTQLARAAVAPHDAPLCTVLGWLAYADGDGALARIALERALTTDPGHVLAQLLITALDGMFPASEVRRLLRPIVPDRQRQPRGNIGQLA